jgi:AbrB family looped-hinge helix DNA binding protein
MKNRSSRHSKPRTVGRMLFRSTPLDVGPILNGNTSTGDRARFETASGDQIMRVTNKGQVTIPQEIRRSLGIVPGSQVEFTEEHGRVYLVNRGLSDDRRTRFSQFRGAATVRMSTDEIMALTRGQQ